MGWIARRLAAAAAFYACALPVVAMDLFNNTNTGGVQNGPTGQALFMTPNAVHVTQIVTYHWNNGQGARPGTIALRSMNGSTYGPFQATGSSGQGNAPNVNWTANVDLQLGGGTYQVVDSDPSTWSQNAQSGGVGFSIIRGDRPTGTPAVVTAPPAPPTARAITVPPPPASTTPPARGGAPSGPVVELFNNTNPDGVQNGPAPNTMVTLLGLPGTHVSQLQTYHWNNGKGAKPGTLTLKSLSGPVYGPFPARGTPGQNNAPNVNWIADVSIDIGIGTYQLVDSDPATWSQNAKSHGVGFAIIRGTRSQAGTGAGTGTIGKAPTIPLGGGGGVFSACMTNAGAIASMAPCSGAPNTRITFKLLRSIAHPIKSITFKPYQVTGIAGGTAAQVLAPVSGNATAAGSYYSVTVPKQLCIGNGGSWDLFPFDTNGTGQGDIGRFTVDCRPGAPVNGAGAPAPTTVAGPAPAGPAPFKPCFVNSGSVAQVSPCMVHVGDIITVRTTANLKSPIGTVTFKPYQVGVSSGVRVAVVVTMKAPTGTDYNFPADPKLCVGGTGQWDVWPTDKMNQGLGNIGRVSVICQ